MNIFILDKNPMQAARMQCDKHVVKMILESAQMLCTNVRTLSLESIINSGMFPPETSFKTIDEYLHKTAHFNHPCTVWARQSRANFNWLWWHAIHLCYEYTYRYKRIHANQKLIMSLHNASFQFPNIGQTPFALAMPDDLKTSDPVASYRMYYLTDKKDMAQWNKRRRSPQWWQDARQTHGQPEWWCNALSR